MNKFIGMAVAVGLSAAATIAFAQTTPTTPTTPPPAPTQPAPHPMPQDPAMPHTPMTPATPMTPPAPAPTNRTMPDEAAPSTPMAMTDASCRTRKSVGQACACLKDPSRVGEAQAHPEGGRNICLVQ